MDNTILQDINIGFHNAKEKTQKKEEISSQLISSIFVHEVASSIYTVCFERNGKLKVIGVNDKYEKISGEWLVDSCIVDYQHSFIKKITFALESESNTSKRAFNEDFAKIIHLNAEYKLYLNGTNQKTEKGTYRYIDERLRYAESVLKDMLINNLYLAFWPSPRIDATHENIRSSLWKNFDKYPHLNTIHLYKYTDGKFVKA